MMNIETGGNQVRKKNRTSYLEQNKMAKELPQWAR